MTAVSFEFTKRKRYAELLISELSDSISLVLHPQSLKVLFCSPSVHELLGWRDDEVIDGNFQAWCLSEDRMTLTRALQDAMASRREALVYMRLIKKGSSEEVLFEVTVKSYHRSGEDGCKCFFLAAKPYPSRNTAM